MGMIVILLYLINHMNLESRQIWWDDLIDMVFMYLFMIQ